MSPGSSTDVYLLSICSYWVEGKSRKNLNQGSQPGYSAYATLRQDFDWRNIIFSDEVIVSSSILRMLLPTGLRLEKCHFLRQVKRILRSNWAEQPPVRTPEELWDRVLDAWEEMAKNLDLFYNLVDSMQRRMRAVVDAGEWNSNVFALDTVVLGGLAVTMLLVRSQIRGFKPGRGRRILK
ncbi:hypothetical protein ANN_26889, partial [Periplaneta americana]